MQRNTEIGFFAKPSFFNNEASKYQTSDQKAIHLKKKRFVQLQDLSRKDGFFDHGLVICTKDIPAGQNSQQLGRVIWGDNR